MTGYGRGEAGNDAVSVVVELRSVNNRFRDIQVRAPREYMGVEPQVVARLKAAVQRGRIEVFVHRQARARQAQVTVNEALLGQLNDAIHRVDAKADVPWTFLLERPGVLVVEERPIDGAAEWPVVEAALDQAIDGLRTMRGVEGQALEADLVGLVNELSATVGSIQQTSADTSARLQARLASRLAALGVELDPQRMAQEVAILADKADISEELARLRSHEAQFREALASEAAEPVGRRLEFLVQELNREVNTIGSKTADHPVSRDVVALKTVLERMREQSANVE